LYSNNKKPTANRNPKITLSMPKLMIEEISLAIKREINAISIKLDSRSNKS